MINENMKKLMQEIVDYNIKYNEQFKDILDGEIMLMNCLDPNKIFYHGYKDKPYLFIYNLENLIKEDKIYQLDRKTLENKLKPFFKDDKLDVAAALIYQDREYSKNKFVVNKLLFDSGKNFFQILKDLFDLKKIDSKNNTDFNTYWFKNMISYSKEYKDVYNSLKNNILLFSIQSFIENDTNDYKFNKFIDINPMELSRNVRDFIRNTENVREDFPKFVDSYLSNIKELAFTYDKEKTYECSDYYLDAFESIGIEEVVNFINEEYDFYKDQDKTLAYNNYLTKQEIKQENYKAYLDFKYNDYDHPNTDFNYNYLKIN